MPLGAHAQVVITEVLYNLEGADSGHEWIEVANEGTSQIDLTTWRFFENGTNHTLTAASGGATLAPGSVAIIADDAEQFLLDTPAFSGVLFDSAFSLSNEGETLIMRNADLEDIATVSYTSDDGASGDGNSLHREGSAWVAAAPTPGALATGAVLPTDTQQNDENVVAGNESTQTAAVPIFFEDPIFIHAYAGEGRMVTVGAGSWFRAKAVGAEGELLDRPRYIWNFGNGVTAEGRDILHHYTYPGRYVVTLTVASGPYTAMDRIVVRALPADIVISAATSAYVELFNRDTRELDLSFWRLRRGETHFTLPEYTVVLPGSKIRFPQGVTGLSYDANVALLYPNGMTAVSGTESTTESLVLPQTAVAPAAAPVVYRVAPPPASSQERASLPEELEKTDTVASSQSVAAVSLAGASEEATATPILLEDRAGKSLGLYVAALVGMLLLAIIGFFLTRTPREREYAIVEET